MSKQRRLSKGNSRTDRDRKAGSAWKKTERDDGWSKGSAERILEPSDGRGYRPHIPKIDPDSVKRPTGSAVKPPEK